MMNDYDWCVQVQDEFEHAKGKGGNPWELNNQNHIHFYLFFFEGAAKFPAEFCPANSAKSRFPSGKCPFAMLGILAVYVPFDCTPSKQCLI